MSVSINFPDDINDPDILRIVLANAVRLAAMPVNALVLKVRESDGQIVEWTLAGQDEIEMLVAGLSIEKTDAAHPRARAKAQK